MDEELLSENLNFRVNASMRDILLANVAKMGSTKDIVLRELVRSFNDYCDGGRRPVFPLQLASPGYVLQNGRMVDATPIISSGRASTMAYPQAPADTDARAVNEVVTLVEKVQRKKKGGPSAATDSARK